ncbi:Glutamine synthetase [Rhynchospora pubera]|uniref:Glutamine synthetase n=1 Tax=Rhynchospora pubera TaxID=906938 RepID=A0AAV8EG95_9POAL|nr:Glutamine synthetase [Rhynchospora pubera]
MKSIAAYRSGLEINPCVTELEAEEGLFQELNGSKPIRITNKGFIDYIFTRSLEVAVFFKFPVQVHTGLGDKDLDLKKSNPIHLRTVLADKRFGKSKIVLLHASYPFSKEASYLASAYSQVYLDFGLATPNISVQGMISSLKNLLELAPTKKVMFSTNGYAFPETFYLGAKRSRDVVFNVLSDACGDGDLTIEEALEAVKDIFRENALRLYKLNNVGGLIGRENVNKQSIVPKNFNNSQNGEDLAFVRIIWVDASGQHRCRVVPAGRFYEEVKSKGVGLPRAVMGLVSYKDELPESGTLTLVGEIRLVPDMTTIARLPWSTKEEMVLAEMHVKPGEAWEYCPRSALLRVTKILQEEFNLVMNAGFEKEFYILKKITRNGAEEWGPFDSSVYCSTSAFDTISPILQEAYNSLQSLNISVEQLHAEVGKGQFEFSFKYLQCNFAADNIIYAREVIRSVARKHGLLATFVPKYCLNDIESGCHVHISLSHNGRNVFIGSENDPETQYGMSKIGQNFLAGVYHHLPAILAFTAPIPNSYVRIQPHTLSGNYHIWGKENREAPIRTACPPGVPMGLVSNFEIRTFDGCVNPHLGLASILVAGIDGLRRGLTLPEPLDVEPSDSANLERLPKDLGEAVAALVGDKILKELIGEKLVSEIIAIRKAEIDYYSKNPEAYKDLIHHPSVPPSRLVVSGPNWFCNLTFNFTLSSTFLLKKLLKGRIGTGMFYFEATSYGA